MRTLFLDKLKDGLNNISPAFGTLFAEAAAVRLTLGGHKSGVILSIQGDFKEDFVLEWSQEIGQIEKNSWGDLKEAVEYGATAISMLLMLDLTTFDSFKREDQLEGTDFELRNQSKSSIKDEKAKLEISGILKETQENKVNIRVKIKERKIKKRGNPNQQVYIVVVEFGTPKAKIILI
jgi:hypothetical protein